MNMNEEREERRKSDRYSQFYTKSSTYQTEQQYEETTERNRQKKSSKSTALSISSIFISFMALLTSFIAIAIASINPKEVYTNTELYSNQESEKTERENDNIELTIPSDFVDATTQKELDNIVKEKNFISATLNSDGSATYIITKSKHKELMEEIVKEINYSLNEMIGSEECPNITDIKTNSDFTNFTLTTTSTELSLQETLSVMIFYTYGGMYNVFNGTPVDNVHIDFINEDSGDIIDSFNSADMEATQAFATEKEVTVYQDVESENEQKLNKKESSEAIIEKQVVFEQYGILITATGLDLDGSYWGPTVKFLIENNTEKNLNVQVRNFSVNGYMVETSMSAEISSGKKINDSLTIYIDSLEESGIGDIEYIDFSFHIFNDDSWDDSIDTEMIHIETSSENGYIVTSEENKRENGEEKNHQQEESDETIQEEPSVQDDIPTEYKSALKKLSAIAIA